MNKDQFAKLFDLPDGSQVLAMMAIDEDNDAPGMRLCTHINGIEAMAMLGFEDEKKQEEAFVKFDKEGAEVFRKSMVEMFKEQ